MGLSYETRTDMAKEAERLAYEVRDKWYPELKDHEVTFSVLLAFNLDEDGKEKEPPLMDGDYRIYAKPSVVNLINRSDERADCQILIDGHHFKDTLPDADRIAIMDGAIAYFELQTNKDGTIKTDSIGRPKLGLRSPDFLVKGFVSVARRHGNHAIEVQAAKQFQKEYAADVLGTADLFAGVAA